MASRYGSCGRENVPGSEIELREPTLVGAEWPIATEKVCSNRSMRTLSSSRDTKSASAPYLAMISLLATALLTACGGDPIGAPCEFKGSGFSAGDNCRYRCLDTRQIICPDGSSLRPSQCSGASGCEPGGCPDGQVCYAIDDPFNRESYCVPADLCGGLSPAALDGWEQESFERAAATRALYEEKRRRREAAKAAGEPLVAPEEPPDRTP